MTMEPELPPHAPNADLATVVIDGAMVSFPHTARVVIESRLEADGSRALWIRIEETGPQVSSDVFDSFDDDSLDSVKWTQGDD